MKKTVTKKFVIPKPKPRLSLKIQVLIAVVLLSSLTIGILFWQPIFVHGQHAYFRVVNFIQSKQPQKEIAHGTVERFTMVSPSLDKKEMSVAVYLPPGYAAEKTKKLPVLYLLHGTPGAEKDWLINAQLPEKVDQLLDSNDLLPMIIVMPNGNGPVVGDSQYVNASDPKQQMEDFIVDELVKEIDQRYQTIDEAKGRAIGGVSSGAFGAVNLWLRRPETFGTIISMSGYFINEESVWPKLLHTIKERTENTPLIQIDLVDDDNVYSLAEKKAVLSSAVLLMIGKNDTPKWVKQNQDFAAKTEALKIKTDLEVRDGGHGWGEWRVFLPDALKFASMNLARK